MNIKFMFTFLIVNHFIYNNGEDMAVKRRECVRPTGKKNLQAIFKYSPARYSKHFRHYGR